MAAAGPFGAKLKNGGYKSHKERSRPKQLSNSNLMMAGYLLFSEGSGAAASTSGGLTVLTN
jgi:hypothetical protein